MEEEAARGSVAISQAPFFGCLFECPVVRDRGGGFAQSTECPAMCTRNSSARAKQVRPDDVPMGQEHAALCLWTRVYYYRKCGVRCVVYVWWGAWAWASTSKLGMYFGVLVRRVPAATKHHSAGCKQTLGARQVNQNPISPQTTPAHANCYSATPAAVSLTSASRFARHNTPPKPLRPPARTPQVPRIPLKPPTHPREPALCMVVTRGARL